MASAACAWIPCINVQHAAARAAYGYGKRPCGDETGRRMTELDGCAGGDVHATCLGESSGLVC